MFDIFQTLFRFKEKESPDELGYYPERVHVDAFPERRYLWTSRLLVILAGLGICFNMMLASTIYLCLPQIKVTPRFYRINRYFNEIETIQPQEINYPVSDLITEEYITNYIKLRYTITEDFDELANRWDEFSVLYWMSSPLVYQSFKSTDMEVAFNQFRRIGLQRYVEIEWIRPLAYGLWQTQFKTLDYTNNEPGPVIAYWRATMRIAYANLYFREKEQRSYNPYGFLVMSYSLAYHGDETGGTSYIDAAKNRSQGR